jgi:hypothetical protein
MNLKTYLSIKFIVYVFFLGVIAYLGSTISSENRDLKKKNEILMEQKEYYEKMLKLSEENTQGKKLLYESIKMTDSIWIEKKLSNKIPVSILLNILIMTVVAWVLTLNYLDKRINKLKSEESDFEKQQML